MEKDARGARPLHALELGRPAEEEDAPPRCRPASWIHSYGYYTLDGTVVVGHRLKVASWVDSVPCWAAPGSVVAKLAERQLPNVLRVHGWAKDGESTTTALVVTDVPPPETVSTVLRDHQTAQLVSHALNLSLITSSSDGIHAMRRVGLTAGSINTMNVFAKHVDAGNPEQTPELFTAVLDPLFSIVRTATGTPAVAFDASYSAPELLGNSSQLPTHESDLYAFGALSWAIVHYPQELPWAEDPYAPRQPLTADPCFVPSASVAEVISVCTNTDPQMRSVCGQVRRWTPSGGARDPHLLRSVSLSHDILGRGAFGAVHRGNWNGVEVAVKVLDGGNALSTHIDVRRELALASIVSHPNIAQVYGWVEQSDGRAPWLVMKFYPQGNLEHWLKTRYEEKQLQPRPAAEGGPFGWSVFFDVSTGIARALSYLADRDLVHRDIKPSNVLMDGEVPVLADFGQGRRLLGQGPEYASRKVGTVHYAAMELTVPGSYSLTPKADVFSMGVLMKYLLLWRPRTVGKTSSWDPPAAIADLIAKCTERDPKDRPDAATVFAILSELSKSAKG